MEFFKTNTKIDFLNLQKWAAAFSIIIFIASIVSLIIFGLNFDLDFTGGTQIQLSFPKAANITQIRRDLDASGLSDAQVQTYGSTRDVMISLGMSKKMRQAGQTLKQIQNTLTKAVLKAVPNAKVESVTSIGAKVSSELAYKGILAVVIAMLITMIYIAFRFEWHMAIGAAVSLVHDPILILGLFSFFHIRFDLVALAAVLTVIGYSLNDTIVIFDRVRENFRKMRRGSPKEIVNAAINQTLSRTIMSAGLVLLVVVVLFFYGGPVIHAFALALIIGIVIGTYSSIYVAGSLAVALGLQRSNLLTAAKKEYQETP
jgi:preprotein translocase subunit SecF